MIIPSKQINDANDIMDHYLRAIDLETIPPDDPNHIAKLQEKWMHTKKDCLAVAKTSFLAEAIVCKIEFVSPSEQISSSRTGLVFIPAGCVLGHDEFTRRTNGFSAWEQKGLVSTGWVKKYVEEISLQKWVGEKLRIAIQSNTFLITKYPHFQYGIFGWPTLIWIKKPTFSIPTSTIESGKSSMWIWKLLRLINRHRKNPSKG